MCMERSVEVNTSSGLGKRVSQKFEHFDINFRQYFLLLYKVNTEEANQILTKRSAIFWASPVILPGKNLPAIVGDSGSIPGSGRSPGEGNGNPVQYSCLENPMDRGTWRATVHRVTKRQILLK